MLNFVCCFYKVAILLLQNFGKVIYQSLFTSPAPLYCTPANSTLALKSYFDKKYEIL